ncbi:hypothetical protein MSG28_015882 [Choristoneura fumiferana]|uniref:Uncharacterized protein n=1 Tax=Choristoneura fumiferana TaxID=7141 RepID=A0ACC0K4Z4_CHOFU|nr:hypothetical protein MSG28_015882 [Choristoneura fumiferana]
MDGAEVTLLHQSFCATCLSKDRKLFPINDSKSHASFLLNLSEDDALCWECHYFVRKVAAFRSRAARAQALLASALHQANETQIKSLSSLMRTPVHLDVNIETPDPLQVNIKMEIMKEEDENILYECPVQDNYDGDNVPREKCFDKLKSLLPDLNKQTAKGDEAACGEEIGDDIASASLKLSERKDLDQRQEHPCKLESDAASEYSRMRAGVEPTRSQTLRQLKHGDGQLSCYTIPVTFDCNLKRQHVNQQATPRNRHVHALQQQSRLVTPLQKQMVIKPHVCNACGKRFNTLATLNRHIMIHTGEKLFTCDTCDKRFIQKSALISHLQVHTVKKPFKCDTCDKRFRHKSSLTTHLRIHTGEKPFSCDSCDKHFNQRASLISHLFIHRAGKQFSCDICDKRFNRKSSLKEHSLIHTGEKPFVCDKCGKRFNHRKSLTMHIRNTHTDEKPISCNLATHMRIHTGERPYGCDVCGKRFKEGSALKAHVRIHTDRKLFPVNDSKSHASLLLNAPTRWTDIVRIGGNRWMQVASCSLWRCMGPALVQQWFTSKWKFRSFFTYVLSEDDALCWECHFFVRKVAAFRSRAARAQALLASALHQANVSIEMGDPLVEDPLDLSSLMMTPVYLDLDISLATPDLSQVNIKAESVKEECENTSSFEYSTEDTCNNTISCDGSRQGIGDDDESLLRVLNKEAEAKDDERICGEAVDDDIANASLKSLLSIKKIEENDVLQLKEIAKGDSENMLNQCTEVSCYTDNVYCDESSEEMGDGGDDILLPVLNKQTEAKGDEGVCGEALSNDLANASLKSLLSRKSTIISSSHLAKKLKNDTRAEVNKERLYKEANEPVEKRTSDDPDATDNATEDNFTVVVMSEEEMLKWRERKKNMPQYATNAPALRQTTIGPLLMASTEAPTSN